MLKNIGIPLIVAAVVALVGAAWKYPKFYKAIHWPLVCGVCSFLLATYVWVYLSENCYNQIKISVKKHSYLSDITDPILTDIDKNFKILLYADFGLLLLVGVVAGIR